MKKVLAFAGSTSSTSMNKQLVSYTANQLKKVDSNVIDLNDFKVPVFSEDLEKEIAYPEGATKFNELLDNHDGFIISLAEHNGSYAAAFKNLFDWVSRKDREVFRNKPVLLMATSPGARGGATVLASALGTFPHMGANITGSLSFPKFYDNFKEGVILNEEFIENLSKEITEFEKALN